MRNDRYITYRDNWDIERMKCRFLSAPQFELPPNAAANVYTDVPRPAMGEAPDPKTGATQVIRWELPQFPDEIVRPIYEAKTEATREKHHEMISLINRVWKGPYTQYNGSTEHYLRQPTQDELFDYWKYLPSTVSVPNILLMYQEMMARYQQTDTDDERSPTRARERHAHFEDDHHRSRYNRSRSRTSPSQERYDPALRQMPQHMHDRRVREYQKPRWLGQDDTTRRHRQPEQQHITVPPPGSNVEPSAPSQRTSSRPPLQAPTAQSMTKDTPASSSQVRLHSQPPQVPNKSPRLDSPARRGHSDAERDNIDEHGKPDIVLTPRQAAAAAQSKKAPRADSRATSTSTTHIAWK